MKLIGGKILINLILEKIFNVSYSTGNVIAADINESNVTLAVFVNRRICEIYRIDTSIDGIVIAYSERRENSQG